MEKAQTYFTECVHLIRIYGLGRDNEIQLVVPELSKLMSWTRQEAYYSTAEDVR